MAIVHIATKAISRKLGQSAVASAAYRASVTLKDERYDKSHNYSKKSGVMSADIILPAALKAKGLMVSREELWNKAEHVEGRTDSRVAREWLINLPHELDEAKRKALAHEFAQTLADKYNIIADCAIHSPSKKEVARGADPRNYHAHILVTTREAKMGADGKLFFDQQFKIAFEWSNKKRNANGLQSSIKEIKEVRQLWVDMANKALAKYDLEQLDARSFKDQGLDRLPMIKMGVDATNMERNGIRTNKGNINKAINQRNNFVANNKTIIKEKGIYVRNLNRIIEWSDKNIRGADLNIDWAISTHRRIVENIADTTQRTSAINFGFSEMERVITHGTDQKRRTDNLIAKGTDQKGRTDNLIADYFRAKNNSSTTTYGKRIEARDEGLNRIEQCHNERIRRSEQTKQSFDGFDNEEGRVHTQERLVDKWIGQRKYGVAELARCAKAIKLEIVRKILLRHKEEYKMPWAWDQALAQEEYPHKFDKRQIELLDAYVMKNKLDIQTDESKYDRKDRLEIFVADNNNFQKDDPIMRIILDPENERLEHAKTLSDVLQGVSIKITSNDTSQSSGTEQESIYQAYRPKF